MKYLIGVFLGILLAFPAPSQDASSLTGTITVLVPPEDVLREGVFMVAKEVTGSVEINIGGKTYTGTLTFPDTKVRRIGVGKMRVDQCVATGSIR